jgi:membrane associated rhomboid family serine protease
MNDDNIIPFRKKSPSDVPQSGGKPYPPMFNIPPVTKILLALMVTLHAGLYVLDKFVLPDLMGIVILYGGFIPASWMGAAPFLWSTIFTPFTYTFLHGSWLHVLVNAVMFLTGGAALERWTGAKRMCLIFFVSSFAAAFSHFLLAPSSLVPVVGASGGISGLFGALLAKMQVTQGQRAGKWGIWPVILVWVGISAIFGIMGSPDGLPVAWIAHIGGFLCGIVMVKFMRPATPKMATRPQTFGTPTDPPTTPPTIH